METIAIVNHKGGVGKTTTALNFGAELALRGKSVLLVDFDAQGNLTKATGINGSITVDKIENTIASALEEIVRGQGCGKVVIPIQSTSYQGVLNIVPSNIQLAYAVQRLNLSMARETYLGRLLEPVSESGAYDYCIIDTAPSIGIDFQNALVASDRILIVLSPDVFSTEGMAGLINEYNNVKELFNHELEIAGVLINNYDSRTVFSREMVSIIKDVWSDVRVFDTVVPKSIRVQESQAMHQSIREYCKGNAAGVAFSNFTNEFLSMEVR